MSDVMEALPPVTVLTTAQAEMEITRRRRRAIVFNEKQWAMVRSFFNGADEEEMQVLGEMAAARGLDPLSGQVHFVMRMTKDPNNPDGPKIRKWAIQVSIDGFRSIADDTGLYDGQDEPEFEYPPGKDGQPNRSAPPMLAKVRIWRKGIARPFVGIAHLAEFTQRNHMWSDKPHVMLAKCAEAQGMRKAFPLDLGGLHAPEELMSDEPPAVTGGIAHQAKPIAGAQQQRALEPPRSSGKLDWMKLLADCPRTNQAIGELGGRMNQQLKPGKERDAISAAWRKLRDEVAAEERAAKVKQPEPPKEEPKAETTTTPVEDPKPCPGCGEFGHKPSECPDFNDAQEPEPTPPVTT